MKKTVLYITYIDFGNMLSGSSVRPQKMYQAFIDCGFNIKLLSGSTKNIDKKKRVKNINEIREWLKFNTPDFCYIESPTTHINFKEDRDLIKLIHDKGIKIGYFYRDALYKLGKDVLFNEQKINVFSKKYIKFLYNKLCVCRDEKILKKYVDIVYFPSLEMAKFFKFKRFDSLPPAGEIINYNNNKDRHGAIYVGGISKSYGIDLLLDTFEEINKEQNIDLILVCRKNELCNINSKYLNKEWLKIKHASGNELKKLYETAKIAVMPKKDNLYNSFAVSVKTYEYMSYGLPIVANANKSVIEIFEKNNIGLLADFTVEDFKNKILYLYNNEMLINKYKNDINDILLSDNLWIHRVTKVENDLIDISKNINSKESKL